MSRKVYIPKVRFTCEEDRRLAEIVNKCGTEDWELVAKQLMTRTARQCRDRWVNYLSPSLSNAPWTQDEDELLMDLYKEYGSRWTTIAEFLPNRSPNHCRNRFKLKEKHSKEPKSESFVLNEKKAKKSKNAKKAHKVIEDTASTFHDNTEIDDLIENRIFEIIQSKESSMFFNDDILFDICLN